MSLVDDVRKTLDAERDRWQLEVARRELEVESLRASLSARDQRPKVPPRPPSVPLQPSPPPCMSDRSAAYWCAPTGKRDEIDIRREMVSAARLRVIRDEVNGLSPEQRDGLRGLRLEFCQLGGSQIPELQALIEAIPGLRNVSLAGNPDLAEDPSWIPSLGRLQQLESVDLADVMLPQADFSRLLQSLASCSKLSRVTLTWNDPAIDSLSEEVNPSSKAPFHAGSSTHIVSILRRLPRLTELCLRHCSVSATGWDALLGRVGVSVEQRSTAKAVDANPRGGTKPSSSRGRVPQRSTAIGQRQKVASGSKRGGERTPTARVSTEAGPMPWTMLHVQGGTVRSAAPWVRLASALRNARLNHLQSLAVEGCRVDPRSWEALMEAIAGHGALRRLSFRGSNVRTDRWAACMDAVGKCATLEEVDVGNVPLSDPETVHWALSENPKLRVTLGSAVMRNRLYDSEESNEPDGVDAVSCASAQRQKVTDVLQWDPATEPEAGSSTTVCALAGEMLQRLWSTVSSLEDGDDGSAALGPAPTEATPRGTACWEVVRVGRVNPPPLTVKATVALDPMLLSPATSVLLEWRSAWAIAPAARSDAVPSPPLVRVRRLGGAVADHWEPIETKRRFPRRVMARLDAFVQAGSAEERGQPEQPAWDATAGAWRFPWAWTAVVLSDVEPGESVQLDIVSKEGDPLIVGRVQPLLLSVLHNEIDASQVSMPALFEYAHLDM